MNEFLSIGQAAKRAGVTSRTVHDWIAKGLLAKFTTAAGTPRTFVRADDLDALTTPREVTQ